MTKILKGLLGVFLVCAMLSCRNDAIKCCPEDVGAKLLNGDIEINAPSATAAAVNDNYIVFYRDSLWKRSLSLFNRSTNEERVLVNSPRPVYRPVVNNEGKIAFYDSGFNLWVYDLDDNSLSNWASGSARYPDWAPSSGRLLYFSDALAGNVILDSNGSFERFLVADTAINEGLAAWSPNENLIAMTCGTGSDYGIGLYNLENESLTKVVDGLLDIFGGSGIINTMDWLDETKLIWQSPAGVFCIDINTKQFNYVAAASPCLQYSYINTHNGILYITEESISCSPILADALVWDAKVVSLDILTGDQNLILE